jgi:NAD(P)-dependent dehydrogenase (short-subunit alcohol dehydrogenase family)
MPCPPDYQPAADLLAGRVILITGAGQGVGRAAALDFARHGATVVLLGRTVAKLEATYDAITAAGGPMPAIFPVDLAAATDADCEALAQAIAWQLGRLDGILHAATEFRALSPLAMQDLADWTAHLRVNLMAPAAVDRACEALLAKSPDASVILLGETHGHAPAAFWGGFAVSKAALEAYCRIQAEEWSDLGQPRINLVIPGPIASPLRARTHPGETKEGLPSVDGFARYLTWLMGPDSRDVRGQILQWSAPPAP